MSVFCSVVAGVLCTFTRFLPVNVLARVDFFGMTTMAFGLGKPSPGQKKRWAGVGVLESFEIDLLFVLKVE